MKIVEKQLVADVWERIYRRDGWQRTVLLHDCGEGDAKAPMLRDEVGVRYWCGACGYIVGDGESMALRLNEVDI